MNLFGVYILCENPIVLVGAESAYNSLRDSMVSHPADLHFIRVLTWSQRKIAHVLRSMLKFRKRQGIVTHHACNELIEQRRFKGMGLKALWCNHNAFLPENTFQPAISVAKEFDAVYTAQIWPYKRIHLASKVASLRIVTGVDKRWHDRIGQQGCGHAKVNQRRLSREEVSEALNQCRCGLALSKEEGAMFACTEYLLCGLPVVSTPSIGGRDVWFDDYNSVMVEPAPEAVASAVTRVAVEGRDPQRIRAATLERMQHFRQTLVDYINVEITKTNVLTVDELFGDGLGMASRFVDNVNLPELLRSYRNGRFEATHIIGH